MAAGSLRICENGGLLVVGLFGTLFKPAEKTTTRAANILDAIFYLAGLASNPADIDPLLDTVRRITATELDGQVSTTDTNTLINVYLQIEAYLGTREPIRTFTSEELRSRLSPEVQQQIQSYQTNN